MTDTTPRAGAPLLAAAQAQKHVTHNEALYQLDALLCARFLDRDLSAPPSSPADGDTYLVKATATGAWAGQDGRIAYCADGGWRFYAPFAGLVAYVIDETALVLFDGVAWTDYGSLISVQSVPHIGVNTTADSTNKLSVQSDAVLFTSLSVSDGGSGDMRVTLNKQASANTATLLFQDAFSGRAEIGLAGDDDFHFKVSPDGSAWADAIILDRNSGAADIPAFTNPAKVRAAILGAPVEAMADLILNTNIGMEISQENGANSVALAATSTLQTKYLVDGVQAAFRGSFTASAQQVTDCPPGFRNSLMLSVTGAQSSLGANDELSLVVPVEGVHAARLAFGTAQANGCAVFFWVKSHRTGAFSGSLRNAGKTRSFPFSFTVNAADTWEMKSTLIGGGDTSGTWAIDTGVGLCATICIAGGSSRTGAANGWTAGDCSGVTGTTNGVAATSDVFQVTGLGVLPLVAGAAFADIPDAAHSPFILRPYPSELLRAKRYYQDVCRAGGHLAAASFLMQKSTAFTIDGPFPFPVEMRVTPQLRHSNPAWVNASPSGNQINFYDNAGSGFLTISGALTVTTSGADTPQAIILRLQAGTSFNGTIGDVGNLYLGSSAYLAADARL